MIISTPEFLSFGIAAPRLAPLYVGSHIRYFVPGSGGECVPVRRLRFSYLRL
ncbi:MAG: hypothetical protein LBH60_06345 [Prevotellaceae bacterium]|nr:hypothetical protein [Prevotellaceae bacterium]